MADSFSHTVSVDAPPERVWDALQRAETWRNIGPIDDVWDESHDEGGHLTGYRWRATAAGRAWEGEASTTDADPGRRLRMALESSEVGGAITVEIDRGEITVTMEASPRGTMARLFWGVVKGALERGLPAQVEAFAAAL